MPLCPLNHIRKCPVNLFFEHFQGWWLNHLPGEIVPMLDFSPSKQTFPNIQPISTKGVYSNNLVSKDHISCKRSLSPTIKSAPLCSPLKNIPNCHIRTLLSNSRDGNSATSLVPIPWFPGSLMLFPVSDHLFSE